MNKVSANRSTDALDNTEYEKALKLLYALDRSVWDLKVNTTIESASYETLTVNELFSSSRQRRWITRHESSSMVPLLPRASLL